MPDLTNSGVNNPFQQAAAAEGDTGQPATGQGDTGQPATDQDINPVPYSRFKEKVDETNILKGRVEQAESQIRDLNQQIQLAGVNRVEHTGTSLASPKDVFAEEGLTDEDYPTVAQMRKAQNQHLGQLMGIVGTQMFISAHPDFKDVVGVLDPKAPGGFKAAAPLEQVIKRNPALLSAIGRSPDGLLLAYELAKTEAEKTKPNTQLEAQEKIINATRVGSASSVGGSSGISQAQRFATMPKADFQKIVADVKAGKYKKGV